MLAGKRILLIIGGGIAAYKGLDLIRRLRERGATVTPVMTRAAEQFVTPLSVSALAGEAVHRDLFDLTKEAEMDHIQLSRVADLVLVVPATADLMAKMVSGLAGDLATTLLMATDTPVMIAPAMNVRMWQHPATQRNLAVLKADGVTVVGPDDGDMACGEFGPGRLSEVPDILAAVERHFAAGPLAGKRVLVTSGPTHEPIDPVRYIANRSSGRQGFAIAAAAAEAGARVTLVAGPVHLPTPAGVMRVDVETAIEMEQAVYDALPADVAIMVAAVADWRADSPAEQKIKKAGAAPEPLQLTENPDILAGLARHEQRPGLLIGFAAETEKIAEHAKAKLEKKSCDWIVANDVSGPVGESVMGGTDNSVHIVTRTGTEIWERLPKAEVARRLVARIGEELADV